MIIAREGELRQLRKQTTELEEQNAILSKHIENMKQVSSLFINHQISFYLVLFRRKSRPIVIARLSLYKNFNVAHLILKKY